MPRTKLGDKYSRPKEPPTNYLSELLKSYRKANSLTDDDIAARVGATRVTVSTHMNQMPDKWKIGDLRRYCKVLGCPFSDALELIARGKP